MAEKDKLLIAEVGNNHFGDFRKAMEMAKIAKESGADLVKMQAFDAADVKGSMVPGFYKQCAFSPEHCAALIEF